MIAKQKQQTLRTFAQERLLREMLSSSDTEAGKQSMKPTGYLLVLDHYTAQIVNSVVQMKELLDHKIVGLEMITTTRKKFSNMHAIYFLEPKEENINNVVSDAKNNLYEGIHLYFTRGIPDPVFESLRANPEVISMIVSFKELNLDFLVIDDCQFTLDLRDCFNLLYNRTTENPELLELVSERLYTLISVFLPTNHLEVICEKKSVAEAVANSVIAKFKSVQAKLPELLSTESKSIKVLVLDRSFDVKAPVFHDFYYLPMAYDLADIRNNKVEFATQSSKGQNIQKQCVLNETDELWVKYRFCHIAEAERLNREGFDKFLKENGKAAKMQKGMQQNLSIDEMQTIIKDMPEYTELLTRFSLHMHIIGKCLDAFNVSSLKLVGDTEQTIATGVDGELSNPSSSDIFTAALKTMGSGSVSPSDKLRIAMLVVSSMHLSEANLSKLKSQLSDSSDLRALENLLYLGIRNDASKGATKSRLMDEEKKYFKSYARAAKYDLQRYTPRLQVVLEELLAGKLNKNQFNIQTVSTLKAGATTSKKLLSNDLLAFKSNNMGKKATIENKEKLIVFFLGGMAHSEVRVVKECEATTSNKDIIGICGGTSILNPEEFIQELLSIGGGNNTRRALETGDISIGIAR